MGNEEAMKLSLHEKFADLEGAMLRKGECCTHVDQWAFAFSVKLGHKKNLTVWFVDGKMFISDDEEFHGELYVFDDGEYERIFDK